MVRCSCISNMGRGVGVGVKSRLSAVWFMNFMNWVQTQTEPRFSVRLPPERTPKLGSGFGWGDCTSNFSVNTSALGAMQIFPDRWDGFHHPTFLATLS